MQEEFKKCAVVVRVITSKPRPQITLWIWKAPVPAFKFTADGLHVTFWRAVNSFKPRNGFENVSEFGLIEAVKKVVRVRNS